MANYYNLAGWRKTGFNYYNRPYNREVLSGGDFQAEYFQMDGIQVNRDDMGSIQSIRVPGSVKDLTGEQINPPNSTGPHGPGGPWYSWEEVDYIRLTRTGYPGDPDYVDISGNALEPWAAGGGGGKLFIAYYFVVGMKPIARDVTELFLMIDEWTTMGGPDELEIESGFKVRGHITEEEDESTFNLAPEPISPIAPLKVKAHKVIEVPGATVENTEFIVSSIDLTQYQQSMSVDAFVAQAVSGQSVAFPAIRSVSDGGWIRLSEPDGSGGQYTYFLYGYRLFDQKDSQVQHNMSILYSSGQLELQDSYQIPTYMIDVVKDGGKYTSVNNKTFAVNPMLLKEELTYPRKARYMYGQEILYSLTTGDMNAQPLYNIEDETVMIWALVTPTGSPYARFKKIMGHEFLYDQSIQGMTWAKKAVVLQGASGSMWNQVNNEFAQQANNRARAITASTNLYNDKRFQGEFENATLDTLENAINTAGSAVSVQNLLSGGKATVQGLMNIAAEGTKYRTMFAGRQYEMAMREFRDQSLNQRENQINAGTARANMQAPYVNFVPDLSRQLFTPNGFAVYLINLSENDDERIKNYFLRYGYNGLYKPLTWEEINVKQKVNYVQCEAVVLRHDHYPMRMLNGVSSLLSQGVFLWNQKPDQSAFADNPDN